MKIERHPKEAGEMAQLVQGLCFRNKDLSSNPRIHIIKARCGDMFSSSQQRGAGDSLIFEPVSLPCLVERHCFSKRQIVP